MYKIAVCIICKKNALCQQCEFHFKTSCADNVTTVTVKTELPRSGRSVTLSYQLPSKFAMLATVLQCIYNLQ